MTGGRSRAARSLLNSVSSYAAKLWRSAFELAGSYQSPWGVSTADPVLEAPAAGATAIRLPTASAVARFLTVARR